MHPNPAFRQTPRDANLAFSQARSFGILMVNGADGPLLAHVPFLIPDDGTVADLHLARSNPLARVALPTAAVIAVAGPDAYISPDWYGLDDQVPTWNYVAVHLRGQLHPLPAATLRDHANALSARFEAGLAPKKPWVSEKMADGVMDRMMRMILPFRLVITSIDGTWKLNQNKPAPARLAAAQALDAHAGEAPQTALARLMRQSG